jgi:hypothetical protein
MSVHHRSDGRREEKNENQQKKGQKAGKSF